MIEPLRIGGREDLQDYLDQFNGKNYERQIRYYAPDVEYKVGSLTLSSPRQIADFYAEFHQYSREFVEIGMFAMTGDTVAVTMPSHFEPFRDYVKNGLSFKAGDVIDIVSFIFYKLKDGQIHRIRVARYNGTRADFE
ncbi:MAG: hypothetical protein JWM75_888 [Sphingomonas bacterium]|nr:hypothetical protein [Sphingomonas bacterium]